MAGRNVLIVLVLASLAVIFGGLTVLYIELVLLIGWCVLRYIFDPPVSRQFATQWLENLTGQVELLKSAMPEPLPPVASAKLEQFETSYRTAQRLLAEEEYQQSFDECLRAYRLIDRAFWITQVGDEALLPPE